MKIGFFITARLKSSRLKQKILLDLNGNSVLDWVIMRSKKISGLDGVVLCTSTNPQDSILYDHALRHNIQFYPGSEDDVLDRLCNAAKYYGYDAFVSITADNPLFSIHTAQIAVDWFKKENFDFVFTKGIPIGCASYLINTKALEVANYIKKETFTEIWGPFVNRSDFFKIGNLKVTNSPFDETKRLTCDYPEDYQLLQELYSRFRIDYSPGVREIFGTLQKEPNLWKINEHKVQQSLDKAILKKINEDFNKKIEDGKTFAKSINKNLESGLHELEIEI
jgi:spore coat polysaccharide biosynthesis protein SpsF